MELDGGAGRLDPSLCCGVGGAGTAIETWDGTRCKLGLWPEAMTVWEEPISTINSRLNVSPNFNSLNPV